MYLASHQMFKLGTWGLAFVCGCSLTFSGHKLILGSVNAVTVPSTGIVSFNKSPRLIDASATFTGTSTRGATYYFDINLPEDAGEPLEQIIIRQRQGQQEIKFRLSKTVAYVRTHHRKKARLNIATVTQDPTNQAITIIFDDYINPGTTFTVGIKPRRNPFYDGVYLFGITAFPAGEKSKGLYLGVGRFHFYRSRDYFWW